MKVFTRIAPLIIFAAAAAAPQSATLPITVDPRMELLAAVQALTDYPVLTQLDFPYRTTIRERFAPYKDHAAVKMFAAMWPQGYNYDGPVSTMICLSNPPELKLEAPASECGASRAGGETKLLEFLDKLRDFARASGFMAFFRSQQASYEKMIEATRAKITGDYTGALYRYVGSSGHAPAFILAPMYMGNYGLNRKRPDGSLEIFNVMGPEGVKDGLPDFASGLALRYLAWHEFGHSFTNPVVDAHKEELEKYSALYTPIAPQMRRQAYGEWLTTVYEHLLRAVNIRMAYAELGRIAGDAMLREQRLDGFAYVPALVERLKEYEANRAKYPTIRSFGPRIVDVFREIAESKPGPDFYFISFDGTLGSAGAGDSVVFIVPTKETDAAAQRKLLEWVKLRRNQVDQSAPVLTDEEALKTDLSGKTLRVYGTLSGNLWLAKYAAGLPFQIGADHIVAGKPYTGEKLRIVAAWPNPQNPKRAVIIYTALKPEDLLGIGAQHRLDSGFVVLRGTEILSQGPYVQRDGRWVIAN